MSQRQTNDAPYAGRPSVCRSCGALVGMGESNCAVCGAPVGGTVDNPRAARHDVETMRFARAVLTRPATFTIVFLVANVLIFLLMQIKFSGAGGSENYEVLRAFGAKYNSLINAPSHEWWRFVTPVFLHIGWLHLLVNMYSLFIIGPFVERLYGSAKFVFFWIATGVAGVVASYLASSSGLHPTNALGRFLFRGGDGPSAGASGALFGLIGVLFVFGIKFRHELPEGFKRAFGTGLLPTILINLFIGYAIPVIDNAAHLGGFTAGVALALFIGYKRPGERGPVAVAWHVLQVAALALVVAGFAQVALHFKSERPSRNSAASDLSRNNVANIVAYIDALNEGQRAFPLALEQGDLDAAGRAIEKLDHAPPLDPTADLLRGQLKILVMRARALAATPKTTRGQMQVKQLLADYDNWDESFNHWVETEGKNYGLALDKQDEKKK